MIEKALNFKVHSQSTHIWIISFEYPMNYCVQRDYPMMKNRNYVLPHILYFFLYDCVSEQMSHVYVQSLLKRFIDLHLN